MFYFGEHLRSAWQISDDAHIVGVLKLAAKEQLDVRVPECNNALVVTISYHFEDLGGMSLPSEPVGSGSGHHCLDYDKAQAEKDATGNALQDVSHFLFRGQR